MVSSTFHQIQNNFSNWNVLYAVLFEKQYIKSRTFSDKNRWIIKKVMVLKKLLPHLATRGTYSPGDWRCDEAWREQTLVYHPVMCQQRLIYCTWELNVMQTHPWTHKMHCISLSILFSLNRNSIEIGKHQQQLVRARNNEKGMCIAYALKIPQSCPEPSIYKYIMMAAYQSWLFYIVPFAFLWHSLSFSCIYPGPLFTKKTPSYQYRDSHYKPETVVRPS